MRSPRNVEPSECGAFGMWSFGIWSPRKVGELGGIRSRGVAKGYTLFPNEFPRTKLGSEFPLLVKRARAYSSIVHTYSYICSYFYYYYSSREKTTKSVLYLYSTSRVQACIKTWKKKRKKTLKNPEKKPVRIKKGGRGGEGLEVEKRDE